MDKRNSRDELVFLEDILESIQIVNKYIEGISKTDFEMNLEKQDAIIRRIEIIGEAVKNISNETRNQYPDISWREMAGMRDILVHQYFGVSIGLIWKVAAEDIPKLEIPIKNIIEGMLPSSKR